MTVGELIEKLEEFDQDLPVALENDYGDPEPFVGTPALYDASAFRREYIGGAFRRCIILDSCMASVFAQQK